MQNTRRLPRRVFFVQKRHAENDGVPLRFFYLN